jgi:BirA family transcriptional regulator, biotin operon repressor / biotin---[acetyl-CoA-carboxylase] ligase
MRCVHFDVTDSTNTQARRLAAEYPGQRVLVTAGEQSAGRGRMGRTWHSPRGGAWMTLVWPLQAPPGAYAAASLVAGLATLRALREVAPQCATRLRVKWPNDLLLDGRKVAGILCEQVATGTSGTALLLVGVGVNVDFDPATLGPDLRHPATTLRTAMDQAMSVDAVVDVVARRLVDALTELEQLGLSNSILQELRDHLAHAETVQTFNRGGQLVTGRVVGIDSAGRLVLACEGGEVALESGELLAAAPASAF